MNVFAIPLSLPCCDIEDVIVTESAIELRAVVERLPGICPACHQISTAVHGYYSRQIHDLPIWQKQVIIKLRVRRYRCENRYCQQKTYAQRCPKLVRRYQRSSNRLTTSLYHIGQELGGQAGNRLATNLTMGKSRDTLLRIVRRMPDSTPRAVRVLGIDDWAMRKGRRYGTILVDLEAHHVVDLLPARDAETVKAWLIGQPQIEIVARDRSQEYALAIREGVPGALQVADRWHLLKNLSEVTERALQELYPVLKKRMDKISTNVAREQGLRDKYPRGSLESQRRQQRQLRKMKQYELCHYLSANGLTQRRIASIVGISRGTVIRYLRSESFPEGQRMHLVASMLDPFLPYLEKRYQAGIHNASQLWREIKAQGYPGTPSQVRKWFGWRRQRVAVEDARPPLSTITPIFLLPPVSDLYKLLLADNEALSEQDRWLLERVSQIPEIQQLQSLISRFRLMVTDKVPSLLDDWLKEAQSAPIKAIANFAYGIAQDYEAVRAALSYEWSNGQTEGQVNRLKMLKRQMYGRAKLDLLKKRIMYNR